MKLKVDRRFIGIASVAAVLLFVSNPELFALSFVISSIGFDVFLLFLTFQFKDQLNHIILLVRSVVLRRSQKASARKQDFE